MPIFDGSEKVIGKGAQAVVYYCNGFAYKVYNDDYPEEWIKFEIFIQNEVANTNLPVVKYYETEVPNIIKMDYIDGITLGSRMRLEQYNNGIRDIILLEKKIHKVTDLKLLSFSSFAINDINSFQCNWQWKERAINFLEDIPEKNNLIHLDFHVNNIMYAEGNYYIIDWINARIGNPIFDYARTYIIMNEFMHPESKEYQTLLLSGREIDTSFWEKAVYVMALLRLKERRTKNTLELLQRLENK